jgi:hypothetical protein
LFRGDPIGPDLGYGPALFASPPRTSELADFLETHGATRVRDADMPWLRAQQIYAWPALGDQTISDQELKDQLDALFATLRSYVGDAAQAGDGLLVWTH